VAPQLDYAQGSGHEHDQATQHGCEQKVHCEGRSPVGTEKGDLHLLKVLQDENEDHDQQR
jgi:hypothetical protein